MTSREEHQAGLARLTRAGLAVGFLGLTLAACVTAPSRPGPSASNGATGGLHGTDKPYQVGGTWYRPHAQPDYDVVGYATWYGAAESSWRTANGEPFDQNALTGAHRTLPLPSLVEVTNLDNDRKVLLRINDRGPFTEGYDLDVSRGAAQALGFTRQGRGRVRIRYVGPAPAFGGGVQYASTKPPSPPARRYSPVVEAARYDEPMAVTPRRPQGRIESHSLTSSAPTVSAPPTFAPAPLRLAAADPSRFTEPSVDLPLRPATNTAVTWQAPPPRPVSMTPLDRPAQALPVAPESAPPAASAPSVARLDGYSVQAGAFSSRDRAERVAAQLGSEAAIRPLTRGEATLYRVVLAGYPDASAAEAARLRAAAAGFTDARVISTN